MPTHAASYSWTGAAGDNNWSTSGNWSPSGVPGTGSDYDQLALPNAPFASSTTMSVAGTYRINRFQSAIDNQKELTLNATNFSGLIFGGAGAKMALNGEMTLRVNAAVSTVSDLTIESRRSNILFGNTFRGGSNDVLIDGDAGTRIEMNGQVSGIGELTKAGEGTLVLSAANTAIDALTVKAGALHLGHNQALAAAMLTLGDAANPDTGVTLEAVGADRTITNDFDWVNNALMVTGTHRIILDPATPAVINLTADRSIDVDLQASLVLGGSVSTTGSAGLSKSGLGRLEIRGGDHAFSSFTVSAGTAEVTAPGATYALGSTLADSNPLGTGSISVDGGNSRLELNPDDNTDILVDGTISLDHGGVFALTNRADTYLRAGAVLDGGTGLSTTGTESLFIFRGDLYLDGGSLANTPNIQIGQRSTLYNAVTTGSAGELVVGFDDIDNDTVTLDATVTGLVADWIRITRSSSLILGGDGQIGAATRLRFGDESTLNTKGFSTSFSDLAWTGSTVWADRSTIILGRGIGTGGGTLHFTGTNIQGGAGSLVFDGWVEGSDRILFDYDIASESWFNRISFYGYNDELGAGTFASGSQWELKPLTGAGATPGVFIWNSKAFRGEGVSKSTNNDASLGGNWDLNRVPIGTAIELIFSNLDSSLTNKNIQFNLPSGQVSLGKLTIADNVTGIFTITGSNSILFDNNGSQAEIYVGTKALSGSQSYKLRNNIFLSAAGLKFTGMGGVLELNGTITGSGNIDVYGTTGKLDLRGENTAYTGTTTVHGGVLNYYTDTALGSGALVMEGGGIGASQTNRPIELKNQLIINNDFGVSGGNTAFVASGNAANDRILLTANRKISGSGALTFREGRDIQGSGGLSLAGSGGVVTFYVLSGNTNFSGGLTIANNTNYMIGQTSDPGLLTGRMVFGEQVAGANYAGTGDITFTGGGYVYVLGGAGSSVDFRNGVTVSGSGSGSGMVRFNGQFDSIRFTDINVAGNVMIVGYGKQVYEIGDMAITGGQASISLTLDREEYGSIAGDALFTALNTNASILGLRNFNVSGLGYSAIFDSTIEKVTANTFQINSGRLELTRDNQVSGVNSGTDAALTLGAGSVVSSKGVSNRFGEVRVSGATTLELGDGGELTLGHVGSWGTTTAGVPFLMNIENNSGVWNTASSLSQSLEHVWLSSTAGWTDTLLAQIAFTGYTRGAEVYDHGLGKWELLPSGDPAFEWVGDGGTGDTSWSTALNWFAGRVPGAIGDIAIFRDQDGELDGKAITLTAAQNIVSQLNFEGTKDPAFSIDSATGSETLRFAGDGGPARIMMSGFMSPTINAAMSIDGSGLVVSHSVANRTLALNGVIRDTNSAQPGSLTIEGSRAAVGDRSIVQLGGSNTFSGGVVQRGGTLQIDVDGALGTGAYTVEGQGRFGGTSGPNIPIKTVGNDLHLKATGTTGSDAWILTGSIVFNDDRNDDVDGYLYNDRQIIAFDNGGTLTFGANYTIADAAGPSQLVLRSGGSGFPTIELLGQNTFSGGVAISGNNVATIAVGASSRLVNDADPSQGVASGPLGTGTLTLATSTNHVLGIVNPSGVPSHYVLHNTIALQNGSNSGQMQFFGGRGSLTLDSAAGIDLGSQDRRIFTGLSGLSQTSYTLVIKSMIDGSDAALDVWGDGYVRFSNTGNVLSDFRIGLKQYDNGTASGKVSVGADNVLGDGRIGVYAWTSYTMNDSRQSFLQAYAAGTDDLVRTLDNLFDFNAGMIFEGMIEEGGVAGGSKLAGTVTLNLNGSGASNLNANTSGSAGTQNQRTFTINSERLTGSSDSDPTAQYASVKVSFGRNHDLTNGGLLVNGNSSNYNASLRGLGGELELLGSKTFAGFTDNGSGSAFLGAGYDTDSTRYALVLDNYAYVTTTLADKDMVIGAVDADGSRETPFGQGEILLNGLNSVLLVRTGDNQRDVYLEDGLFEVARGTFEVAGGGDLILGRRGDGSHFNQMIAGRNGQDGLGTVKTSGGSRVIVDAGTNTVTLRANMNGQVALQSGTLSSVMNGALSGVTDLTFNGGRLNLNQISQTLAANSTLSLGGSTLSTLDFGGLPGSGNVVLTAGTLGSWNADGQLIIKGWNGDIAGNGRTRFLLSAYDASTLYLGNILFEGYATGARLVQFGAYYEILPYAATYIWTGTQGTSWASSANWKDNDVPNITNASVTFGDEAVRMQSQLSSNITIGDLIFSGSNNQQFDITAGAGGQTLIMEHTPGSGRDASIVMLYNSDAIIRPNIELRSHLGISNELGADLELRGNIYNRSGDPRKVTKNGGGTLTMSGANTFTGGMEMNEGVLRVNVNEQVSGAVSAGAVGTGDFTIRGGTIEAYGSDRTVSNRIVMADDFTVGGGHTLTLGYTSGAQKSALTGDVTITVLADSSLVVAATNVFSCNGKITKEGLGYLAWNSELDSTHTHGIRINNGTMVLSAANNYTGGTQMAGGVLAISNNSSLGYADSAIDVLGNSTLRIDADLTGVANDFTLQGGNTLTIQTADGSASATDATLAGDLSGAGGIRKTGGGTLTLTGDNTFTGTAAVASGTLQIGDGGTAGSLAASVSLDAGTHLVFNHSDVLNYAASASGAGDLTKLGTGRLVLSGASSYTGGTKLDEGTITVAHNQALGTAAVAMADGTTLDYADGITLGNAVDVTGEGNFSVQSGTGTQSGIISGGSLDKTGAGTLALTGTNTFTGDTTVSAGTLQLGNGGTTGSILAIADAARQVDVASGAALAFNRSDDLTFLGAIDGDGQVIQRGTNTVTFTSAQTYQGGSVVEQGVLKIRDDGTVEGNVEIQSDGTFLIGQQDGDYELANTFTGNGTLAIDISEDSDHTLAGYDPSQFSFGDDGATAGAGFSGTVDMRRARYDIDDLATGFLNAGGAGLKTSAGSIGHMTSIADSDPAARYHRIDGTVHFAGGEMNWYFDSGNQAESYLSAGAIIMTAPTLFKLNLSQSLAVSCADSVSDTSLFCATVNGMDSLLLGVSENVIAGPEYWTDLEIWVNGHLQYTNDSIRQSVSHASPEVAKGVFDWTVYTTDLDNDVTELRVGYQLKSMEIFHGRTLEVLLGESETNNNFNIALTDYDDTSKSKDTRDLDVDSRVGSGHVLFSDRSTGAMGIVVNGDNSYTGTTTVDSATRVMLGSNTALGSLAQHTTKLDVSRTGSVLDLNDRTGHVSEVAVSNGGNVHLGANGSGLLHIAANTATGKPQGNGGGTVSGDNALTGKGGIHVGTGTLTINDRNTSVEAATSIAGGATAHLTHVNALGQGTTAGSITADGTLQVNAAGTLDNLVAGSGLWQKMGSGQLTSARDNTFTGNVLVSGGTLTLTGSNAAVGGTELTDGTTLELGQDDSAGSSQITMSGATGTVRALADITTANSISIAGTGTLDTNGHRLTSDGLITGAGSLAVTGAGTLAINRANDFAGTTSIDGSTVVLGTGGHDGLSAGSVALANGSTLELGFSNQTFDNIVTGAAEDTVLISGGNVTLAPSAMTRAATDNSDFAGVWSITGSANISGLSTGVIGNIGADSTVELDGGALNLTTTDDAALTFANKLRGDGRLNIVMGMADNDFRFDTASVKAMGNTFTGTLSMKKGLYRFSTEDATGAGVLASGTLELATLDSLNVGGAVLDGTYRIGALAMEGGTLKVDTVDTGAPKGMLTVDRLTVDNGGTVALNVPSSITQAGASGTLFDDDGGIGAQQMQLVRAVGEPVPQHGAQLAFTNYDGSIVGNPEIESQVQLSDGTGTDVAEAFYGYVISVKGDDTAASGNNGIYLGYGMNRINSYTAGTQYQLSNTATSDNVMGALLTSTAKGAASDSATVDGGFEFKALGNDDASKIIIANAGNNYTGKTLVSQGTVQYALNNAFGKTSELELGADTTVDLNGKTQTGANAVGQLTMNASGAGLTMKGGSLDVTGVTTIANGNRIDLGTASGRLTLSGGGSIAGDDALAGSGSLDLNGTDKTLRVSGSNTGLSAIVDVRATNTAVMDEFDGLGSGQLNVAGTLRLAGATSGSLANTIDFNNGALVFDNAQGTQSGSFTGSGAQIDVLNGSVIELAGSNAALAATDTLRIDADSSVTARQADNLGLAAIANSGLLTLDYAGTTDWVLGNAMTEDGRLLKQGTGTVVINRANDRTGATDLAAGGLTLGHVGGLGTGDIAIQASDAVLTLSAGATGSFANAVANDGVMDIASTSLDLTGNVSGTGAVNVLNGANVNLLGDNTGFTGENGGWNIASGGRAVMSANSHLGTTADVTLDGLLTVDRSSSAGDFTWMNHLSGSGVLAASLSDTGDEFVFDDARAAGIGSDFNGIVRLGDSTFKLAGAGSANTDALASATLESQQGNHTILEQGSGAHAFGGLHINGGLMDFVNARVPGDVAGLTNDHITLQASGGTLTVTGGRVAVEAGILNGIDTTIDTTANLLTQEDGRIGVQLVKANSGKAQGGTADLVVIDSATGEIIPTDGTEKVFDLMTGDGKVATAHYNFGTTLGTDNDGLYVDYILTQVDIEADKTLVLDNENATGAASDFSAKITGEGHLAIDATGADNKVISLSHGGNTFTGTTTVTEGTTLQAAATIDHIIATSSQLTLGNNSTFDMNGTNQQVNRLSGAGQVLFNGEGILTAINATDSVYKGDILGNGQMVKQGGGTLALQGGRVQHRQGTLVEEGTLAMSGVMAHAVEPLVTLTGDGRATIDGGSVGASGDTLFAAADASGSLQVSNITNYTVGRDGQRLLDATGEGDMQAVFDNVKDLRGDVYAEEGAAVSMALRNNTTLTGKIDPVAMDIDSTSTWNVTADSIVTDMNNSGTVNFTAPVNGTYKTLEVQGNLTNREGAPGTFGMNVSLAAMQSDLVEVAGSVSGSYQIIIKRDAASDVTDQSAFALKLVDVAGANNGSVAGETDFHGGTDVRMRKAKVQAGDLEGNNMEDWFLVYDASREPNNELSNTGTSMLGMSEISLLWFTQMDTLVKRMGELRMNQPLSDNWVDNTWVRTYGSQYNVGSKVIGSGYRDYIYGADMGVDKGWQLDRYNRLYTGVFAGYGGDRKDFKIPGTKGETDSFYFGTYGTWINDCGCYIDMVVKAQHFYHDFRSHDESFNRTSGDYNQWALGASIEAGKMFRFENNWFVEPQAQVSYMHGEGVGYSTEGANSFRANVGGVDALQLRYGANAGRIYSLGEAGMLQPYVKIEGLHQFNRGGRLRADDGAWRARIEGSAVRAGAGVIWQINERNQVHFSYEAAFGDKYTMPWGVNAGYRYQF